MDKRYSVELDEGIDTDIVKEVVLGAIAEAKEANPSKASHLEGIVIKVDNKIRIRESFGIPPEVYFWIIYTHPFVLLTFKEIVIPLIQMKLNIKQ